MSRYARRGSNAKLVVSLITIALACSMYGIAYAISKSSCEKRGGHIEWIYGGRGGWTCDGALR